MPKKKPQGDDTQVSLGAVMTPMLDVAFQVLAFFIMTYHPAALEGHIDGKLLPREDKAAKGPAIDDSPPLEVEPELKEDIIVIVKAHEQPIIGPNGKEILPEGYPKELSLQRGKETVQTEIIAEFDENNPYEDGLTLLKERLKGVLEQGDDGTDQEITLKPDGITLYEYVVSTYDTCRQASYEKKEDGKKVEVHFKNVGFAPPDDIDE